MAKDKKSLAAINAILTGVEALMPTTQNDRGARLRQAEREVAPAGTLSASGADKHVVRAARLANAERDVSQGAKRELAIRAAHKFRNRYNLWRR